MTSTVSEGGKTGEAGDLLRVAVVIGSTREGRFGTTIADWVVDRIKERETLAVDVIDTREVELPHAFGAGGAGSLAVTSEKLSGADAFVVVTPEYNHSYPGSLKNLVDAHHREWQAKPVGFVSYGGISGGLRAVEHLRQVFAELHAVTVRDTVSFANPWGRFDESGRLTDPEEAVAAARILLDQLTWWGTALRTARAITPYGR
ncbi:NADPH-dependent FMN reductase [Nocardia blacklockiae]|uniref:NADPH-dependent FMN reductase n=1 Tax=Nocardia blacklockiae TaxID=480036 RepID=UPI0018950A38|nr:NAD(P)H-dependent oxidoreductase [Nocardia blacklockiae]MBF6175535.1 NAD(P)H-dependent oxidoreductase [Nocardia blacklockiae]